jgi:hypothetical protein
MLRSRAPRHTSGALGERFSVAIAGSGLSISSMLTLLR